MKDSETLMLIYLDEYRKAKRAAVQDRQAVTIATVSAIFFFQPPCKLGPEVPKDLTSLDFDKSLDRIYALASQF
jgi:hypothetical protein